MLNLKSKAFKREEREERGGKSVSPLALSSACSALSAFKFCAVLCGYALTSACAASAAETVIDFERPEAEPGKWIPSYTEKDVTFALAQAPTQSKAVGRLTFFPHIGTDRKGVLCAMATEPIPVEAKFPAPVSAVTVKFWASTGCPARLEALDKTGAVIAHDAVAAAPSRQAPGELVPFFELTVRANGPEIAAIRFSGPRPGEYLAADEVRFQ